MSGGSLPVLPVPVEVLACPADSSNVQLELQEVVEKKRRLASRTPLAIDGDSPARPFKPVEIDIKNTPDPPLRKLLLYPEEERNPLTEALDEDYLNQC